MSVPTEILPIKGLAYREHKELQPLLCKPKLLPIKADSLLRLEKLERRMEQEAKQKRAAEAAERTRVQWFTTPTISTVTPTESAPKDSKEEGTAAAEVEVGRQESASAMQESQQSGTMTDDTHQG